MKAFFLDRDGVINENHSVNKPEELRLLTGAAKAVALLNRSGFKVFVVTNQGGVGLGYMSKADLDAVHERMIELIAAEGGEIKEIRACTHKPSLGCRCRKPQPGMIVELISKYGVDKTQSFMVGDRDVDVLAGSKAGVKTVFIGNQPPKGAAPDYVFPSLLEAVQGLNPFIQEKQQPQ